MDEAPRLLSDATEAFVNRTPVDWTALLSRVGASPDRALFENLRTVAAVRDAGRPAVSATADRRFSLAAWLVVALASIETAVIFVILAAALARGETTLRTPQLIAALAFAIASLALGRATLRDTRSLFLLATFTAAASLFARSAMTGLPGAWSVPGVAIGGLQGGVWRGVWIEAFIPACVWQFALDFPRVSRFTSFDQYARRVAAASWLLGLLLFAVNLAVTGHAVHAGPLAYLLRNHPGHLFWHLFSLAVAPAVAAIFVRSRRAPVSERRKVAGLALALAGGSAPFLFFSVARAVLPAVDDWLAAASNPGSIWLDRMFVATLAATPILSTAAVLADRPFAFQGALRRTSRWALRWRVPRWTVRHHEQLAGALERISNARGARETVAVLARALEDGVGAEAVRVLLARRDGGFAHWSGDAMALGADGGLVTLLRQTSRPLDVSPDGALLMLLPLRDRDWVADHGVHLAAPLRRRDGSLGALVAFGPKIDGSSFNRRDRWWISTLTTAAAAAWDNGPDTRHSSRDEAAFECPACGVVAESLPLSCGCGADPVVAALPRYIDETFLVERRIGAGGMGIVYLARDTALDREVALKTLPALGAAAVRRLRDEARAMAALNHESLATLYGLEMWRRAPVLVVEYFPQGTLARRLVDGPLSPRETVALGLRLARALVYMHSRGVLHRDLKPSNVAFTATGAAKLLDFGLATLVAPSVSVDGSPERGVETERGRWVGTPAYVPPETYRGAPPSPRVDLWALAVVMLEAASAAKRLDSFPALRAFLERALAPAPERRFQSGSEFLSGLEAVARDLEM